jgi:hypothetical protein
VRVLPGARQDDPVLVLDLDPPVLPEAVWRDQNRATLPTALAALCALVYHPAPGPRKAPGGGSRSIPAEGAR